MEKSNPQFEHKMWIMTVIKKIMKKLRNTFPQLGHRMWITSLEMQNFRNYESQKIDFSENVNVFYGDNAQGKTNIIEAIFMCSIGKSFRTSKEKETIKHNEEFTNIVLNYQNKDRDGNIKVQISNKKTIFVNGVKVKKLSELLGKVNIVLFTPDDINILKNGPDQRRKFLNMMIGQIRPNYVNILNTYTKVMEQRNNYLKQIRNLDDKNKINYELLDIWDEKLASLSYKICLYRTEFINKISEKIKDIHKNITENKEEIKIEYITESSDEKKLLELIKQRRKLDIIKGYTTKGAHRDDFNIYIDCDLVNVYGSQGQHRTAVLSLKMSELEIIKEETGESPILLLDDFMSELDSKRRKNLLSNIGDTQVIITCTDEMENNFLGNIYKVKEGKVIK